jgi:hypothetical protein
MGGGLPSGDLVAAPLEVGGEPTACSASWAAEPAVSTTTTPRSWARWPTSWRWQFIARRRCGEALDQQQRRLQELVEHLPEGVPWSSATAGCAGQSVARDHPAAVASLSPHGHVTGIGDLSLSS